MSDAKSDIVATGYQVSPSIAAMTSLALRAGRVAAGDRSDEPAAGPVVSIVSFSDASRALRGGMVLIRPIGTDTFVSVQLRKCAAH